MGEGKLKRPPRCYGAPQPARKKRLCPRRTCFCVGRLYARDLSTVAGALARAGLGYEALTSIRVPSTPQYVRACLPAMVHLINRLPGISRTFPPALRERPANASIHFVSQ